MTIQEFVLSQFVEQKVSELRYQLSNEGVTFEDLADGFEKGKDRPMDDPYIDTSGRSFSGFRCWVTSDGASESHNIY